MKKVILYFLALNICSKGLTQNPLPCSSGTCSSTSALETCPSNGTNLVSSFKNAQLYISGNGCLDGTCAGSVWRFADITNSIGTEINATITIDEVINAQLEKIDDDGAKDQSGISVQSFFSPILRSDIQLNGNDRKGYIQFTLRFFKAGIGDGYSLLTNLSYLSVLNYDIDGSNAGNINTGTTGSWYRENVYLKELSAGNPSINLDQSTELNLVNYTDASDKWLGSMSSLCDRSGISKCSQLAMASRFANPQYSVSFRLGYDYNAGGNIGTPLSQYGIKLSCFNYLTQIQLPVNLYEFTAKRVGNNAQLQWTTTYEQLNQGFRVQRKTGNTDFGDVGFLQSLAPGGNSQINLNYSYTDPNTNKGITQYRILQTDLQDKVRVSEIRSVLGLGQKNTVVIFPNPGNEGKVNIVFDDARAGRDISINDFMGRIVKQWKQFTGNTITAENLLPGIYTVRIQDKETGEIKTQKFIISQSKL